MDDGAVTLALGAGVVAAVNPCGFALLPAYLSLFVLDDQPSRPVAVARAVKATTAMTAGFVAVFAGFGALVAPAAANVQLYLPGFTVALGLLLVVAGFWVLAGRRLWSPHLSRRGSGRPVTGGVWSMTGFGASYAVASLGCTVAPFLAVVISAFRSGSAGDGMVLFLAYALGMGVVVGTAAVAVALARVGVVRRLRRTSRWSPRLAGLLLVVAGGYVAWYGAWELRVLHGGAGSDPVVDAALTVQQWLAENVAAVGAGGFVAVLAVLVGFGLLARRGRRVQSAAPKLENTPHEERA